MTTDTAAPPTPRRDYALLSAAFAAGVAAMSAAARRDRGEVRRAESAELPALALATFGLSRILVHERVAAWARDPFVDEGRADRPPRGDGLRRAVGELLTCTRCTGVWVGAALVGARVVSPGAGRVLTAVFAAAGANDLLQAGFSGLAERSRAA
ncbi:MAG: DUF1360 domain-containing protein [Thermoleophilia bacterium]